MRLRPVRNRHSARPRPRHRRLSGPGRSSVGSQLFPHPVSRVGPELRSARPNRSVVPHRHSSSHAPRPPCRSPVRQARSPYVRVRTRPRPPLRCPTRLRFGLHGVSCPLLRTRANSRTSAGKSSIHRGCQGSRQRTWRVCHLRACSRVSSGLCRKKAPSCRWRVPTRLSGSMWAVWWRYSRWLAPSRVSSGSSGKKAPWGCRRDRRPVRTGRRSPVGRRMCRGCPGFRTRLRAGRRSYSRWLWYRRFLAPGGSCRRSPRSRSWAVSRSRCSWRRCLRVRMQASSWTQSRGSSHVRRGPQVGTRLCSCLPIAVPPNSRSSGRPHPSRASVLGRHLAMHRTQGRPPVPTRNPLLP